MQFVDGDVVVFPCITEMCASFSCELRVKFCTEASFFRTPLYTLK